MAENNAKKTQSKKKQFILFGLCSFLAMVICMVTLVITVKKVENDNMGSAVTHTKEETGNNTLIKNESDDLTEYISLATQMTQNDKFIKVNTYRDITIDDGTIKVDGESDSKDVALIGYVKNQITGVVDGFYGEDYVGEFGTVYEKMPQINLSGISGLVCDMNVGLHDENGEPVYDEEGNLIDKEYYYLTYTVNGDEVKGEAYEKAFGLDNVADIESLIKSEIASVCSVNSASVQKAAFIIRAKVGVEDSKLSYVEVERNYKVKADLEFVNELAVFGEKTVEFDYKIIERNEYSFAGVSFSENNIVLEKGDEAALTVNAVIENDSDYAVSFKSSDENAVTVDEMGYVKVLEERDEPVYITVELNYLGEKFTDECIVYTDAQPQN